MRRILGWAGAFGVAFVTWAEPVAAADGAPPPPSPVVVRPWTLPEVLAAARVEVTAWAQGMATFTPGSESDLRAARVFDDEAEGVRLHQAYGAIQRTFSEGRSFDVGGKVALLWGTDARLLHARGLLDQQAPREYQWDLLELWGSIRLPVAQGLRIKAGKCTTPMGFEVIEAPSNLLPSRSFLFGYAIPFTHTGAIASLDVSPRLTLSYGLFLGWDVWEDNNDSLTHHGGVTYEASDRDTLVGNVLFGPERANDDEDLRTVFDVTWTHVWSDRWRTALNADLGLEDGADPSCGCDATWWGAAAYVTRTVSPALEATLRAEVFRDANAARLGQVATLTGLTLGADWTPGAPFPILHVRPEVRWDHSFEGTFFDAGTEEDQVSLALDLVVGF